MPTRVLDDHAIPGAASRGGTLDEREERRADGLRQVVGDAAEPDERDAAAVDHGPAQGVGTDVTVDAAVITGSRECNRNLDVARASRRVDPAGCHDLDRDLGGVVEAVGELHPALLAFARSPAVLALSARARKRLDRVLPALLSAAASGPAPAATIARALKLLHAILRRSSYLALLAEQPAALTRVVEVMGASALLAERISQHPLLLDDLLDQRNGTEVAPSLEAVHAEALKLKAGRVFVDLWDVEKFAERLDLR